MRLLCWKLGQIPSLIGALLNYIRRYSTFRNILRLEYAVPAF
jgi:hypothetical protein